MTFSKNTLVLVLILSQIFVASCGKRDDHNVTSPQDSDYFESNASFYVDRGGIGILAGSKVIVTRDIQQKPNQKDFKLQACLKDKALMGAVQFQDFRVKAGDNELIKQTDIQGCIFWDEQIRYDGLDTESELLVVREIEAVRGHIGTVSLELSLNPWATEDTLTVTDLRFDTKLKERTRSNAVTYSMTQFQSSPGSKLSPVIAMEVNSLRTSQIKSQCGVQSADPTSGTRMRLDAIQLQFLGHDYEAYEMTPTLNLKVAHKYRLRINPQFIRMNFNGKQIFETIASGNVKFHVALLKDTVNLKNCGLYNTSDVLSTTSFVGEMVDGVMVADVTLKFQDLAPLTGRTIMVLTSTSLPGFIQFRDGSYASPVGPLVAASTVSLVPTTWNAESIHEKHEKHVSDVRARAMATSNFEYFKKTTNFTELPKEIEAKMGLSGRKSVHSAAPYLELITALERDTDKVSLPTKNAICSYLTKDLNVCRSTKNLELVNIRQREIVEEITNPVPERVGITFNEDLTINMNYLMSNEQTKGNGRSFKTSLNAGLNAGLDLNVLDLIGGKIPLLSTALSFVSKLLKNNLPGDPSKFEEPKNGLGVKFGGTMMYNYDLYSWSVANSKKETGSIGTSVKFTANAEMKVFSFSGKFKKCWLANLNSEFKSKLEKQFNKEFSKLGLPEGVYVCLPKSVEGKRNEMFVLVNSITGIANSPMTDSLASSEAPLRMYFRSPIGYSVFKNMMMEKDMELKFDKFPADELIKEVQSLKNEGDMYLNQEFPGVLNPVLE